MRHPTSEQAPLETVSQTGPHPEAHRLVSGSVRVITYISHLAEKLDNRLESREAEKHDRNNRAA